jgi:hypothetical protein
MSDVKEQDSAASANEDKLKTDEFELASRISALLSQYTKSSGRRAMMMVAAMDKQRMVPIGIPVGYGNVANTAKDKASRPKGPSKEAVASWKKDPAWVAAVKQRSDVVRRLKSADDAAKAALVEELRNSELQLGQLKTKLRQA